MTTIAVLQRRTNNLAQRRLQTGADHARADAPSRQLSIPATDTLNNSLNYQPELWLPASRLTNRLEGHGAPALTPSASAKSPSGVRGILRAPSPAGSFLGGFRTPATGVCRAAVADRHPKPLYERELVKAFPHGAYQRSYPIV
jgi:hypothetical protein